MDLKTLNKICFMICIMCIVIGVLLGLVLIWATQDSEIVWKGLGTVAVVFFGSALTLAVSNTFTKKSGSKFSDDNDI